MNLSQIRSGIAAAQSAAAANRGKRAAPSARSQICSSCGTIGDGCSHTRGSILIEAVLWCCFLLPGLFYSMWRLTTRAKVCSACGSAALIPTNSPRGRQLAAGA